MHSVKSVGGTIVGMFKTIGELVIEGAQEWRKHPDLFLLVLSVSVLIALLITDLTS